MGTQPRLLFAYLLWMHFSYNGRVSFLDRGTAAYRIYNIYYLYRKTSQILVLTILLHMLLISVEVILIYS